MWKYESMYCLDTSAVLEMIYGTDKGMKITSCVKGHPIFISSFVVHELLVGLKEKEREQISSFFQDVTILGYDGSAAQKSAEIHKLLKLSGTLINNVDIFIASTCFVHGMTLLSCDADFKKIKGFDVLVY
mgnify:CR=1 FL=1